MAFRDVSFCFASSNQLSADLPKHHKDISKKPTIIIYWAKARQMMGQ